MSEQVTIRISTENDAFTDAPASEIARILRDLAAQYERDGEPLRTIRDANGNRCGTIITVSEE